MRNHTAAALAAAALLTPFSAPTQAGALPSLDLQVEVAGLVQPLVYLEHPTEPNTFICVQQGGVARVVVNGVLQANPFLSLVGQISAGGERGFLGLAFDPDYANNRRFYVNFTNTAGETVIARFTTQAGNPLQADVASRFDFLFGTTRFIDQPFSNHNGGNIAFGPDGMLYVGMGDGGSAGDPNNFAQTTGTLLGKFLRLDVDVPNADNEGYDIPADNPFVDGIPVAAPGQIWCFGVRNPWRWTFDDFGFGATGGMIMADVGQNAWEEVNFVDDLSEAYNFGWKRFEGNAVFSAGTALLFNPHTAPIWTYSHATGFSITGGYLVRGSRMCSYHGRYFYGDFVNRRVWSFEVTNTGAAADNIEHTADLLNGAALPQVSSFARDSTGTLYLLGYNTGTVYRFVSNEPAFAGDGNFDGIVNFDDLNEILDGYTPDQFDELNALLGNFNETCPN